MPAGEVFKLIKKVQRTIRYSDKNTNVNAQGFTRNNSPHRINVTGKRGTGGWI